MIAQLEVNSKDADNRNSGLIQQERVDRFWSLSLVHVTKNMEPCKTETISTPIVVPPPTYSYGIEEESFTKEMQPASQSQVYSGSSFMPWNILTIWC